MSDSGHRYYQTIALPVLTVAVMMSVVRSWIGFQVNWGKIGGTSGSFSVAKSWTQKKSLGTFVLMSKGNILDGYLYHNLLLRTCVWVTFHKGNYGHWQLEVERCYDIYLTSLWIVNTDFLSLYTVFTWYFTGRMVKGIQLHLPVSASEHGKRISHSEFHRMAGH